MKAAGSQPLLPDEVIAEILSRLPVKSLLRFRCVSKSWKSLIYDPYFAKSQLQRSPKNRGLVLTLKPTLRLAERYRCVTFCSLRSFLLNPSFSVIAEHCHHPLKSKYWVLGSCNGLVCLHGFSEQEDGIGQYWVRFWNPATGLRSKKSPILCVNLRVNRLGSTKFGFGYDKLSETYKVVAVLNDRDAVEDSERTQVKVYTMGDRCWRDIQRFPAFPIVFRNEGRFVGGTLNWLAIQNSGPGYQWETVTIDQLVIVSLDLGKETYKQLLLPEGVVEIPHVTPTLGVLGECLCLFHDYKTTHFVVWQMKEFGVEKSWTQIVNVSYQCLQIGEFWTQFFAVAPLCISDNGDVVVLLSDDLEIILYNRRDNTIERTKIHNHRTWIEANDYVQSLVLPC